MLAIVLAVPALAYTDLSSYWQNHIKSFKQICKNVDRNEYYHYTMALQRYLMCFDYTCKNKLYYNGGYMDGDFGGRTEAAVLYLQEQLGFEKKYVDGIVGEKTWGAIARTLKVYTEEHTEVYPNYTKTRIRRPAGVPGEWVFELATYDGSENFYYVWENNKDITPI